MIARRWQKGWNLKLGSGQTPIMGGWGGGNGSVLGSLLSWGTRFSAYGVGLPPSPSKGTAHLLTTPATTWHNSSPCYVTKNIYVYVFISGEPDGRHAAVANEELTG